MGFSYPALDSEHALVEVARQLAELCKERLPECKVTWQTRWLGQIERDADSAVWINDFLLSVGKGC